MKFFLMLFFFRACCPAQDVAETINQEYAFVDEGPIAVLRTKVLRKHSIGINTCEVLVLFFNENSRQFKALVIKKHYKEAKQDPFNNKSLASYEVMAVSEKTENSKGVFISLKDVDSLKSEISPFIVQSKTGVHEVNIREMRGLHDERNCYIFVRHKSSLLGGYIFNPISGSRSDIMYNKFWNLYIKYSDSK